MILITGASSGIGKFLYETYKEKGEQVRGTCLTKDPADGDMARVDISRFDKLMEWRDSIGDELLVDLAIINCAAINYNAVTHKSDPEKWKRVIDVNLVGTYNMIRCFLPTMRRNQYGRIINFSSIVAEIGVVGTSAYAASKAALWGLSRAIMAENASLNIAINSINLGYSDVGMGEREISDEVRAELIGRIPEHRFCDRTEIYNTVEFLRNTAYINGTSVDINGGLI